jgi:hypothetical protein
MIRIRSNQASFTLLATVIVLTSAFSLKAPGGLLGSFKTEEWMLLGKNSQYRSRLDEQDKRLRNKRANFVLCRDCFWCTSQIRLEVDAFSSCPVCNKPSLETIPICPSESYFFDCGVGGINLAFRKDADAQDGISK